MSRKVITVNQVYEILSEYYVCSNWPSSLEKAIPKRKGFVVDDESETVLTKRKLEEEKEVTNLI